MVSDQEIVNGVESLLLQSFSSSSSTTTTNPNSTINGVIQQLEAKLGLDLSHKAGFIRDLLQHHLLLQQQQAKDHFALQFHHQQQQQQHFPTSSGFALHPQQQQQHQHLNHQQQRQHPSEEINFRYPLPPQQQHLYPYPHPLHQQQQQQHGRTNPNLNLNTNLNQPQQQHLYSHGGRNDGSFISSGSVAEVGSAPEVKKESAPTGTKRRGGPGGLNKVCGVTPELEAIVGEPALPRTQIVKQLWAYIRKHNLQDPSNKRKIICNDALRLVFETDCTDMFKMNKLLAKHIKPLEPTKDPGPDSKRLKVETEPTPESTEAVPEAGSEAVSGAVSEVVSETVSAVSEVVSEADSSTFIISDALARFFGTEEREMTQSEAVRRIWEYIKANRLEEDLNPMMIVCDAKLQELFGCENISVLGISEMLMSHFFKQS